ncbi:MAG: hypothetical protein K0Q95_1310 [Bacteroidota bacterium]|jgi:hypothetical protein|nr:hypothetical protein [Bacteroidota bacterium]
MIVKRNSSEFKAVRDFVNEFVNDHSKMKYLKLFSLKPYEKLEKRILLHRNKKEEAVVFDLELEALQFNLLDAGHKLFKDEKSGLYYFKSSSASSSIEVPFQITKGLD